MNDSRHDLAVRRGRIFADIVDERARQASLRDQGKFPATCADAGLTHEQRLAVLSEEFGEVARAVLEAQGLANDRTAVDALAKMRKELIEVAAVSVAWVERLDEDAEAKVDKPSGKGTRWYDGCCCTAAPFDHQDDCPLR